MHYPMCKRLFLSFRSFIITRKQSLHKCTQSILWKRSDKTRLRRRSTTDSEFYSLVQIESLRFNWKRPKLLRYLDRWSNYFQNYVINENWKLFHYVNLLKSQFAFSIARNEKEPIKIQMISNFFIFISKKLFLQIAQKFN